MQLRGQPRGWAVETPSDDDEETRVYFAPPEQAAPRMQIAPRATTPPSPAIAYQPRFAPPPLTPMPMPMSRPTLQPQPHARARRSRGVSQNVVVGIGSACVALGIALGIVFAVATTRERTVEAPPARVAEPIVTPPTVTSIVEPVKPVVAVAPAPPPPPAAIETPAPAPVIAEPPPAPRAIAAPHHHHQRAARAAVTEHERAPTGALAVSTKPPCSIVIDGAQTGLVAPQRAIALPVGRHVVTLVNAEEGIHITVEVAITADRPTQLIRDFSN